MLKGGQPGWDSGLVYVHGACHRPDHSGQRCRPSLLAPDSHSTVIRLTLQTGGNCFIQVYTFSEVAISSGNLLPLVILFTLNWNDVTPPLKDKNHRIGSSKISSYTARKKVKGDLTADESS